MVEQGTHKPLVASSNLALGTSEASQALLFNMVVSGHRKPPCLLLSSRTSDHWPSQEDYIPLAVESFLIDRKAQSVSPETLSSYRKKLKYFLDFL